VRAEEPLRAQTNYFINAIAQNRLDLCGPAEGVAVVRVLEAIQQSMAARGAPVTVPS
jgi:predicted dehydrogenase